MMPSFFSRGFPTCMCSRDPFVREGTLAIHETFMKNALLPPAGPLKRNNLHIGKYTEKEQQHTAKFLGAIPQRRDVSLYVQHQE